MTNDYELLNKRHFPPPPIIAAKLQNPFSSYVHVTNNGNLENKTMGIIPLVLFTLQYQFYFILSLPKQVMANIFPNEFLNILCGQNLAQFQISKPNTLTCPLYALVQTLEQEIICAKTSRSKIHPDKPCLKTLQ